MEEKINEGTFSSLKIRNYRLYWIGQAISVSGTFLQALAQDWLVLSLTNSGTMLGLVLMAQFLPMLLLTFYGGVIADRVSKLKLLYVTQTLSGLLALGLGILVITGAVKLWMVFAFAFCLGLVNSIDDPTRKAFVFEMVGKDQVKNALSLWTILISFARIVGPALAGILIATLGMGLCFIINAASYIAVITALLMIDKGKLHTTLPIARSKGQVREGLRYVGKTPILFNSLLMMAIIGTLTFEFSASLPLFAKFVMNGGAGTYAIITLCISAGMLIGGFMNARTNKLSERRVIYSALLLGISALIASVATNIVVILISFVLMGLFLLAFANLTQSIIQVNTAPEFRGRVVAMWSVGFQGSTAIGGPLIGWIGEQFGARWTLGVGGIAALIAAICGFIIERKEEHHPGAAYLTNHGAAQNIPH